MLKAFQNFICYLTIDRKWTWLDVIIDSLAYLEVNLRLAANNQLREKLYSGDVCSENCESWNHSQIPEHELYCCNCPFQTESKVAKLFYGEQMSGFCYYLNQGDFTFGHPTDLLWDGVKCCGVKTDIDDEDFTESLEYTLDV